MKEWGRNQRGQPRKRRGNSAAFIARARTAKARFDKTLSPAEKRLKNLLYKGDQRTADQIHTPEKSTSLGYDAMWKLRAMAGRVTDTGFGGRGYTVVVKAHLRKGKLVKTYRRK